MRSIADLDVLIVGRHYRVPKLVAFDFQKFGNDCNTLPDIRGS